MKTFKLLLTLAAAVVLSSCSAFSAMQAESDAAAAALYNDVCTLGSLNIEVTQIQPARGRLIHSSDGYTLRIKDGVVNAYLPFIGESYTAVLGSDVQGIQFKDCKAEALAVKSDPDKGKSVWTFRALSGREYVDVTLTIWSNGAADIHCRPYNRSVMNYSGYLRPMPVKNTRP